MGPLVAERLAEEGHELAVFHRGESNAGLRAGVRQIQGLRQSLGESAWEFRDFAPDVAIDFILSSEAQARLTMDTLRGIASRVVALSSGDVYRAMAVLNGHDPGPPQAVPLTEDSELRTDKPHSPEELEVARKTVAWLDDDYDKIPVERVVLNDADISGTVLRLPMVYGPGDRNHRLYPYVRRMYDGRRTVLIQKEAAGWRGPRGYVENVATAIALVATSDRAAGRIYNIADADDLSELDWVRSIGRIAGWSGTVVPVPKEHLPEHLRVPFDARQNWVMSSERIRSELGFWEPVPLDAALERTIAWEHANPPANVDRKQFDYAEEDRALAAIGYRKVS
jgi:nucleoside-diphosphate-sugar epimerase